VTGGSVQKQVSTLINRKELFLFISLTMVFIDPQTNLVQGQSIVD